MLEDLRALVFQYTGPEEVLKLYKSKVQRDKILKYVIFSDIQQICEMGYFHTLKYLIRHKGLEPASYMIIKCIPNGHLKLIQYLCSLINPLPNVLNYAITYQKLAILKFLSAKVSITYTHLELATGTHNLEIFKFCASFVAPTESIIHKALDNKNKLIVKYLGELGLLPTPKYIQDIIYANNLQILDLCLILKIRDFQYDQTPISIALWKDDAVILRKLVEGGFIPTEINLFQTIIDNKYKCFKYLITKVKIPNRHINVALGNKRIDMVKILWNLGFGDQLAKWEVEDTLKMPYADFLKLMQ